ncbi:MAG: hypothetical protein IKO75_09370 [Bacteroidales bacterium]|nr:hypothetical protein [Bacteroidales bacterium]
MNKINEALDLIQKICDINLDIDDLTELDLNTEEKKAILDFYNSARCYSQLDRMKEIIRKVNNGETMWQGKMRNEDE